MPHLKKPRKSLLISRRVVPDSLISEATETDETDHLVEELIAEALGSSED